MIDRKTVIRLIKKGLITAEQAKRLLAAISPKPLQPELNHG